MWHLIEDFFDQGIVMKAFIGLGWLSLLIMVFSLVQQLASKRCCTLILCGCLHLVMISATRC